jgi:hypothetical protein
MLQQDKNVLCIALLCMQVTANAKESLKKVLNKSESFDIIWQSPQPPAKYCKVKIAHYTVT